MKNIEGGSQRKIKSGRKEIARSLEVSILVKER